MSTMLFVAGALLAFLVLAQTARAGDGPAIPYGAPPPGGQPVYSFCEHSVRYVWGDGRIRVDTRVCRDQWGQPVVFQKLKRLDYK